MIHNSPIREKTYVEGGKMWSRCEINMIICLAFFGQTGFSNKHTNGKFLVFCLLLEVQHEKKYCKVKSLMTKIQTSSQS
jgi:hypothetical protein